MGNTGIGGHFANYTNSGGTDVFAIILFHKNSTLAFHQWGTSGDDMIYSAALNSLSGSIYVSGNTFGNFSASNKRSSLPNTFISEITVGGILLLYLLYFIYNTYQSIGAIKTAVFTDSFSAKGSIMFELI